MDSGVVDGYTQGIRVQNKDSSLKRLSLIHYSFQLRKKPTFAELKPEGECVSSTPPIQPLSL